MPINPRNVFYDTLEPGRGGLAWLRGDPTSPLARALGGSIPPPAPPPVAAGGGGAWAPEILRQAGKRTGGRAATAAAGALGDAGVASALESTAAMPLDILRAPGSRNAAGRIMGPTKLGSLFGGANPTGLGLRVPPGAVGAAALADDAAGVLSGLNAIPPPPGAAQAAAAAAGKPGMFARFAPNIASTAEAMSGLSAGARTRLLLGVPEGAKMRTAAWAGLGKAMPLLTGFQMRPISEGLGDSIANKAGVDDSGMIGDFLGGATLGAGVGGTAGSILPGFGTLGGAAAGFIGGGIGGLIGGDRDNAEKNQEAQYDQAVDALHQQLGQFGQAVEAGYITDEEHQFASKAYNDLIRGGAAVEDAYAQAFGPLEEGIMAQQAYEMSPEGQLMAQMEAANREQQMMMMEAQRYAAHLQAPMVEQQQQIYQDLAGVRDQRLQDPNLPADMRAIMNASTPNIDIANLQAIAAASNPLTALMNQQAQAGYNGQNPMTDQLMRMYELQMQYGGQGGGGGDDLASRIQAGALAAPEE